MKVAAGTKGVGSGGVQYRDEDPVLTFSQYAVAVHFAVELPARWRHGGDEKTAEERALESYERDMLLYAYRHVAPLRSHAMATTSELVVRFPAELEFESEGSPIRLRCENTSDGDRVRRTTAVTSRTSFDGTSVAVATLVLRPTSGQECELNEYDLIKLAKLWEGGERMPEPGSADEDRGPIRFELDGTPLNFSKVANRVFGGDLGFLDYQSEDLAAALRDPSVEGRRQRGARGREQAVDPRFTRHYRVGTISLKLPPTRQNRRLLSDAKAVQDLDDPPELATDRWKRVRAVGGVLQGLLDFTEIGPAELSDVFAEAQLEEDSLLAFHKGTLLSLTLSGSVHDEERDAKLERPIGISPYLAIPHAVLLHNEQLLKSSLINANKLIRWQGRSTRRIAVDRDRKSIEQTEEGIREIAQTRAQHLPNIFHYSTERWLYDRGSGSLGFSDFEPLLESRLEELGGKLEARQRRRERWTLGLTIAFFGVAALQLALTQVTKSAAWWVYLLALGALALFIWQLRKRLF